MSLNHMSVYSELTDEHCKLIGKIVVEWANIEFLLGLLLSRLLVTPEFLARSYTDRLNAFRIQEAIEEGIEIHRKRFGGQIISNKKLDLISGLNKKVSELRGKRNKFAHFCWCREADHKIFGIKFSAGLPDSEKHKKSCVTYTTSDLSSFYNEMYELVESLQLMVGKLPQMTEDGLKGKLSVR